MRELSRSYAQYVLLVSHEDAFTCYASRRITESYILECIPAIDYLLESSFNLLHPANQVERLHFKKGYVYNCTFGFSLVELPNFYHKERTTIKRLELDSAW